MIPKSDESHRSQPGNGWQRTEATVGFVDIAGFSAISAISCASAGSMGIVSALSCQAPDSTQAVQGMSATTSGGGTWAIRGIRNGSPA